MKKVLKAGMSTILLALAGFLAFSAPLSAAAESVPIMGPNTLTARQMGDFVLLNNPEPKLVGADIYELAEYYLEIGRLEGVTGDIAFAQAIHETGFFKYGGDVVPEQNNYAGIGTTGGGVKGAYFPTPEAGARAQIQHLKAYASTEPLVTELIDPRFNLVKRGIAPNWQDLNGRWAVPGKGYGEKILGYYERMKQITLSIANTELPANHKYPVARLQVRQEIPLVGPDGQTVKTLQKGESIRVYGVLGNSYDLGGKHLVEANSSKMSVYIGRASIMQNGTPLYKADGTVARNLVKGEAIRVYSYDDTKYNVGGGYYIKKEDKPIFYLGMVKMKEDVSLMNPNGEHFKTLKKNTLYRVYGIQNDRFEVGGGFYVTNDKTKTEYIN